VTQASQSGTRHQIRSWDTTRLFQKYSCRKGRRATDYAKAIGQQIEPLILFRKFELVEQIQSFFTFQVSDNATPPSTACARGSAGVSSRAFWAYARAAGTVSRAGRGTAIQKPNFSEKRTIALQGSVLQ
jgi:hypothetical protein